MKKFLLTVTVIAWKNIKDEKYFERVESMFDV